MLPVSNAPSPCRKRSRVPDVVTEEGVSTTKGPASRFHVGGGLLAIPETDRIPIADPLLDPGNAGLRENLAALPGSLLRRTNNDE
jgi:hypothetical protein